MHTAHADDTAKLRMKISGPIKDNRYFLCVSNVGCVSILAAKKGKVFPLDKGDIGHIFAINATQMRMYPQALPASCNVTVNENQTLTVSGKIIEGPHGSVKVGNLSCSVT